MTIQKLGHSCLIVEEGASRLIIDPGNFVFMDSEVHADELPQMDVVLLTHDHPDHFYPDAIAKIMSKGTPLILANEQTVKKIQEAGWQGDAMSVGTTRNIGAFQIRAVKCPHGLLPGGLPTPENIGFLINNVLFHPGDCLQPEEPVRASVLALPIAAPWLKLEEAVKLVEMMAPQMVIPVHDGFIKHTDFIPGVLKRIFPSGTPRIVNPRPNEPIKV